MRDDTVTDQPIMTREYRFGAEKPGQPVLVEIFAAEAVPGSDFECRFRITGLAEKPKEVSAFGIDSLQATELAMKAVAIYLYTFARPPDPHVYWFEPGDTLALPVMDPIKDLAAARTSPRETDINRQL